MENRKKAILFIAQYPENISPGQRFRFELYCDLLEQHGFSVTTRPFLDKNGYDVIHKEGYFFRKVLAVMRGYAGRFVQLFSLGKYEFIFLQREAALLGPPIFEWLYCKVFRKKVIYDFDDAIWMPHISEGNSLFIRLKNVSKVANICRWAHKVSAGNDFLCRYARRFSDRVVYNPTCVDTDHKHNILARHDADKVTIGWTGSFSTLKYLYMLEPVLEALQKKYDFNVKVICNQPPAFSRIRNVQYVPWTPENEVPELATCQIGLMPLTDDEWSEGKCGFKLIQYLSLEIPAVSSAVGVNKQIIEQGVNGFLCTNEEQWYQAIETMINDKALRKSMGINGRQKIIASYSLRSNSANFLSLFA